MYVNTSRVPKLRTEHTNNIEHLRTILYYTEWCLFYSNPDIDTMIDYIVNT